MALHGSELLLSLAATFVVAAVVYTVTLHLSATFVIGDVSLFHAVLVGPIPAAILVVVGTLVSFPLAAGLAVAADYGAIKWSYDVDRRLAAGVTLGHVVASVLLVVSLFGLFTSLGI